MPNSVFSGSFYTLSENKYLKNSLSPAITKLLERVSLNRNRDRQRDAKVKYFSKRLYYQTSSVCLDISLSPNNSIKPRDEEE